MASARFILFLCLPSLLVQAGLPPGLTDMPQYSSLRNCAQVRIYYLYNDLDCPNPGIPSCFCREDLRPLGSSILTKNVNYYCATNPVDLTAALMVWDTYCSRGSDPPPATVVTTAGGSLQSTSSASPGIISQTVHIPTVTQTVSYLGQTTTATKVLVPTYTGAASTSRFVRRKENQLGSLEIMAAGIIVAIVTSGLTFRQHMLQ